MVHLIYTFGHVELAHIRINNFGQEVWAWDLYYSTALVEAAKSLVLSNVIGTWLGTVPQTSAKVYGACYTSTKRRVYCNVLVQCAVATQRERGIVHDR